MAVEYVARLSLYDARHDASKPVNLTGHSCWTATSDAEDGVGTLDTHMIHNKRQPGADWAGVQCRHTETLSLKDGVIEQLKKSIVAAELGPLAQTVQSRGTLSWSPSLVGLLLHHAGAELIWILSQQQQHEGSNVPARLMHPAGNAWILHGAICTMDS